MIIKGKRVSILTGSLKKILRSSRLGSKPKQRKPTRAASNSWLVMLRLIFNQWTRKICSQLTCSASPSITTIVTPLSPVKISRMRLPTLYSKRCAKTPMVFRETSKHARLLSLMTPITMSPTTLLLGTKMRRSCELQWWSVCRSRFLSRSKRTEKI